MPQILTDKAIQDNPQIYSVLDLFFYVSLLVFTGFDTGVMYHLSSVQTHLMFAQFFSVAYFK